MIDDRKLSDRKDAIKRIWKIRDYIQELEDIKDGIVDFLNSHKKLDDVTKKLWISDVNGIYTSTVSAWELLYNMVAKGKLKHVDNSRHFLHLARGRLAKSISELKYYKEEIVFSLIKVIEIRFEKCWNAFYFEFDKLIPIVKPITKIIKVSNSKH